MGVGALAWTLSPSLVSHALDGGGGVGAESSFSFSSTLFISAFSFSSTTDSEAAHAQTHTQAQTPSHVSHVVEAGLGSGLGADFDVGLTRGLRVSPLSVGFGVGVTCGLGTDADKLQIVAAVPGCHFSSYCCATFTSSISATLSTTATVSSTTFTLYFSLLLTSSV